MISSNENYFLEKQTNNDKRHRSAIYCTAVLSIEIQFMYTKIHHTHTQKKHKI
jgi:hypothetical protein